MDVQNYTIDFFVSCGYSPSLNMVKNIVESRNDISIYKEEINDMMGCGEIYLKGSCAAYKLFLQMSRDIDDPEYWFAVEQLEMA